MEQVPESDVALMSRENPRGQAEGMPFQGVRCKWGGPWVALAGEIYMTQKCAIAVRWGGCP